MDDGSTHRETARAIAQHCVRWTIEPLRWHGPPYHEEPYSGYQFESIHKRSVIKIAVHNGMLKIHARIANRQCRSEEQTEYMLHFDLADPNGIKFASKVVRLLILPSYAVFILACTATVLFLLFSTPVVFSSIVGMKPPAWFSIISILIPLAFMICGLINAALENFGFYDKLLHRAFQKENG